MSLRVLLSATALLLCAEPAFAATSAPTPAVATAEARLWFGAAWYPEQWPADHWEKDLALMEAAHVNVVRIGEFAWSRMEPAEGRYDLDWLDQAIRMAERHHIKVVIGTPTDAPPAWMSSAYPDILRIDAEGHVVEHGGRRQFSISSARYREFSRKIAHQLAARFGRDPNVIGWQIGNEYTDESFAPDARKAFQDWLKARYVTLDALNAAWTTSYWSQTYSAWDQVPLNARPGNPGWMLDHRRFVTRTWRDFQKVQADAIRARVQPRQFVTTNIGGLGWSDNWDHYEIARDLDLVTWDPYVGTGHLDPYKLGAVSDYVRGWKRQNFWVMETQPGFVNWAPVSNTLDRGESRMLAWESVGHGADAVLYWQWRSALNGQEQYHGALVGPDDEPLPFYDEAREIGAEFAKAAKVLAGTHPQSEVAILQTYDSRWAIDFQLHNKAYDQLQVLLGYYAPIKDAIHAVDVVEATAPLAGYKAVFAPSLNLIDDKLGEHLAAYVRAGGHLVLGPRSGMKDISNRLDVRLQPGPLADILGGKVRQFYALDKDTPVSGEAGAGVANIWGEDLETTAPDTQVILRYGDSAGWLAGRPAASRRAYGKGDITYLGALLDPVLMRSFVDRSLDSAGARSAFGPLPKGVQLDRRVGDGREVLVLINHDAETHTVTLPRPMRDVLGGGEATTLTLKFRGVAVLTAPLPKP